MYDMSLVPEEGISNQASQLYPVMQVALQVQGSWISYHFSHDRSQPD
jgi:hypothetical protein